MTSGQRFSLCFMECFIQIHGKMYTVVSEDDPDSVFCSRNILQTQAYVKE